MEEIIESRIQYLEERDIKKHEELRVLNNSSLTMTEHVGFIKEDIKRIKENHLDHLEKDVSTLKTDQIAVAVDVKWLKKFFWIVASSSIGALLTGLINLVVN